MQPVAPASSVEVSVEQIVFRGEDGGFTVMRVVSSDGGEAFVAAGRLAWNVAPLEVLRLEGAFTEHPRFGPQFEITAAVPTLPASVEGIRRFLASGRIKGIGPALADRLVARFGDQTISILETTPERALEVSGVGQSRLLELKRAFGENREWREALTFLQGLGLGPALSQEIWQRFGTDTIARIRENPFGLIDEVPGVGFLTADRIAAGLGIATDSEQRLAAGLRNVLRKVAEQGHVCVAAPELERRVAELLELDEALIHSMLDVAFEKGLVRSLVPEDATPEELGAPLIYLPALAAAEEEAAKRLVALLNAPRPRAPALASEETLEDKMGIPLSREQEAAVRLLLEKKVSLLTGGPGVGKTTVLRKVVDAYREAGFELKLASPTGRAAKRLAQAAGTEAQTLHRLFGFIPGKPLGTSQQPLDADVLIIDEASMLDLPLLVRVLRRLRPEAILILVGDPDQLPSIGPGNVLADLLRSEQFPIARLTTIFRQAEGSRIVNNAHRILRGFEPEGVAKGETSDFYFVARKDAAEGAALIRDLFLERIPKRFGFDPRECIQVLCPMHRGPAGTEAVNRLLQQALNGDQPSLVHGSRAFHVGDRVMMTRNDYDVDVMNGDLGIVRKVDSHQHALVVDFDGREVGFARRAVESLSPAFAISVHKSQGGEYPAVILPLFDDHYLMLKRSLLYTAVTRARELLVIVGTKSALSRAVNDARLTRRRGELAARLQGRTFISVRPSAVSCPRVDEVGSGEFA